LTAISESAIIASNCLYVYQGRKTIAMDLGLCLCRRANLPRSRWIDCRWIVAAGLAIFILVPPEARTAPIEFHYGGVITSTADGMDLAPGTRIQGTFSYDPAASYSTTDSVDWMTYQYGAEPPGSSPTADASGLSFEAGGKTIASAQGGLHLGMTDFRFLDQLGDGAPRMTTFTILGTDAERGMSIFLALANSTRSIFDSTGPPNVLSLADFPDAGFSVAPLSGTSRTGLFYSGRIDTLVQVTTPEPASVAMWLGLGITAWAAKARSRGRA
jgi:hypothetical protein